MTTHSWWMLAMVVASCLALAGVSAGWIAALWFSLFL
jgi:hypothetical protein